MLRTNRKGSRKLKQEVIGETINKTSEIKNLVSRRDFLKLSGSLGAVAALSDFTLVGPIKTLVAGAPSVTAPTQDQWIKSECRICSVIDYINVHVVDGMISKIEGFPDTRNRGKLCARGHAGFWYVYDPYRVKVPLKRTNPQKGRGIDPKWVEISWDEAYNTIAAQAKQVRAKGANGVMWFNDYSRTSYSQGALYTAFKQAMAGNSYSVDMGMNWCGHVTHYLGRLLHGAFQQSPDFQYGNYVIMFGSERGFVNEAITMMEPLTNAHERGMKIVYVNPVMSTGVNTIDEWIPILPSTDGAFASAMLNVLIHEMGVYDPDYIKKWTTGSYLVRADNGYYARDAATNKPLIWDPVDNKAKTFDDPTFKDYAIEGTFTVGGVTTNPGWQLLKDTVKQMTPEWAAPITTVPAGTIRRIANEFGQAAQVGSTVTIGGKVYPLRPAGTFYHSGPTNHVHGSANEWSTHLLPMIIGGLDVPGGVYSSGMGYVGGAAELTWQASKDGLIPHPDAAYTMHRAPWKYAFPPKTPELKELLPFGDHLGAVSVLTMSNPKDLWGAGANHIEFGVRPRLRPHVHVRHRHDSRHSEHNSIRGAFLHLPGGTHRRCRHNSTR